MPETKQSRILIVDDEPSLLRLMERYLSRLGYSVVACPSAEEAWARFEPEASSYSLVLADVTLPGMSGTDLVAKVLGLNPQIHAVLMSGYSADLSAFPASLHGQISFLKKPFMPEMLVESVEELMGRGK